MELVQLKAQHLKEYQPWHIFFQSDYLETVSFSSVLDETEVKRRLISNMGYDPQINLKRGTTYQELF